MDLDALLSAFRPPSIVREHTIQLNTRPDRTYWRNELKR
jgi:hypothetical protein